MGLPIRCFIISARVAPLGRRISARIFAPLLSARGVLASLAWAGLAFVPALALFFGLVDLAPFLALGAPFFWAGTLLRGGLIWRDVRALFRRVAVLSVIVASAFVMVVNPFCA